MRIQARHLTPAVLVTSSLALSAAILGGASQENAFPQMLIELLGTAALFLGISRLGSRDLFARHRVSLILLGAVLALPLLHMLPMPVSIWKTLPGHTSHAAVVEALPGLGAWLPFSLTPDQSLRCFLFLLAPAGMFVLTLSQGSDQQRTTIIGFALAAAVCAVLGALQVASGGDPNLYGYPTTNLRFAVGTFANKNHTASYLLVFMITGSAALLCRYGDRRSMSPALTLGLICLLVIMTMVMTAVIRSRAGFLLFGLAFTAVATLVYRRPGLLRKTIGKWSWTLPLGAAVLAIGLVAATPVLSRFAGHEPRFSFWPTVFQEAQTALPLGTGLGSFQPVYASVEPLDTMVEAYINHAHNDYLELLLEAGLPGIALLTLILIWIAIHVRRIWFAKDARTEKSPLAEAASLAVLVILLHSFVDYPLRTEAMSVYLAYLLAIICSHQTKSAI